MVNTYWQKRSPFYSLWAFGPVLCLLKSGGSWSVALVGAGLVPDCSCCTLSPSCICWCMALKLLYEERLNDLVLSYGLHPQQDFPLLLFNLFKGCRNLINAHTEEHLFYFLLNLLQSNRNLTNHGIKQWLPLYFYFVLTAWIWITTWEDLSFQCLYGKFGFLNLCNSVAHPISHFKFGNKT